MKTGAYGKFLIMLMGRYRKDWFRLFSKGCTLIAQRPLTLTAQQEIPVRYQDIPALPWSWPERGPASWHSSFSHVFKAQPQQTDLTMFFLSHLLSDSEQHPSKCLTFNKLPRTLMKFLKHVSWIEIVGNYVKGCIFTRVTFHCPFSSIIFFFPLIPFCQWDYEIN